MKTSLYDLAPQEIVDSFIDKVDTARHEAEVYARKSMLSCHQAEASMLVNVDEQFILFNAFITTKYKPNEHLFPISKVEIFYHRPSINEALDLLNHLKSLNHEQTGLPKRARGRHAPPKTHKRRLPPEQDET